MDSGYGKTEMSSIEISLFYVQLYDNIDSNIKSYLIVVGYYAGYVEATWYSVQISKKYVFLWKKLPTSNILKLAETVVVSLKDGLFNCAIINECICQILQKVRILCTLLCTNTRCYISS